MNQLFQYITDFHQKHRVATHLLFWLLVYGLGIFTTATSEGQPLLNFEQNIVWHLMMMVSKIPFAYLVVYVTIPLFFDKKKYLLAIELFANDSKLVFCLENTMKPSAKQTKSSDVGIGLKNLRQQLSLIYGEKYGLEIHQTGHHFKVVLTIQATN